MAEEKPKEEKAQPPPPTEKNQTPAPKPDASVPNAIDVPPLAYRPKKPLPDFANTKDPLIEKREGKGSEQPPPRDKKD